MVRKSTAANMAKHGYEATVKWRALARAGANPHINGHILEIMASDKTNLNPVNWVRGIRERLSTSTTDPVVDSVVTRHGRVIARIQYKDCSHSIGDVIRRVRDGNYDGTTLRGSTETATVFNRYARKHGLSVRMQDTGISQKTTKSLGRSLGACKQVPLSRAVVWSARSGGIWGGVVTGGLSFVTNGIDYCRGRKSGWLATECVVKDAAGGVLSGAGAAAAATATGAAVSAGIAGTAVAGTALGAVCVVGAPVVAAFGAGYLISEAWNTLWN